MSVPEVGILIPEELPDVQGAVKALVQATQHLQEDAQSVEGVENLIQKLKQLLTQERQKYAYKRQNSDIRGRLESLQNLIQYLESQVQRARKVARRRGLKYYLASITSTVLGHEMGRIAQSMESELQSWLDQQGVRELVNMLGNDSEDAQVKAISSFEAVVRKGYDSQLQDTILSSGLVERLALLLELNAAPWSVQKEAAFALSALLDFNRDIFVSLVLMSGVVEKLLSLMSSGSDDITLVVVCLLKSLMSAGKVVIVDRIHSNNGVEKLVDLLDHKSQSLRHAAMDCVFEMAYHGRIEVVQKMLEENVIEKLAKLQQSAAALPDVPANAENLAKQDRNVSSDMLNADGHPTKLQTDCPTQPFANAVTRFALHLGIGTGLRKRERRALKQEFLKRIKVIMSDDTEIANITAEVLWAP